MPQNHVIDPTYFYDAIEEFAFNYDIYVSTTEIVDERGMQTKTYVKDTIRGSLQIQERKRSNSKSGSTTEIRYNFYCKSLYRINIGDFINYKNLWLYVESIHDYDEWGVRSAGLIAVEISSYHDLASYANYMSGREIV